VQTFQRVMQRRQITETDVSRGNGPVFGRVNGGQGEERIRMAARKEICEEVEGLLSAG
jgi:hypothetical protein